MEWKTRSEVGGQTTNFQEKRRKNKEIKKMTREKISNIESKNIFQKGKKENEQISKFEIISKVKAVNPN